MFKYSHFASEKSPVWVSLDLYTKAHVCFFTDIGRFSWDCHKAPTRTDRHINTSGHAVTIIWEDHVRVHSSPSKTDSGSLTVAQLIIINQW